MGGRRGERKGGGRFSVCQREQEIKNPGDGLSVQHKRGGSRESRVARPLLKRQPVKNLDCGTERRSTMQNVTAGDGGSRDLKAEPQWPKFKETTQCSRGRREAPDLT